jgi:hypothetical protein
LGASREDWIGGVLIALCVALVAGAFGAAAWLRSVRVEIDPETLCPLDGPPRGHVVFLIDKTDPLSPDRVETLEAELRATRDRLAAGERLSVFLIHERVEQEFAPIFSRCSPGRGEEANELYENPRMIQRAFDRAFGAPVERALAELVRATTAPRSPILEAIHAISVWPPFHDAQPRELVVVSDLLQNVEAFSQYHRLPPFEEVVRGEYLRARMPDLSGVEVRLQRIERAPAWAEPTLQGEAHAAFWSDYFAAAGARVAR